MTQEPSPTPQNGPATTTQRPSPSPQDTPSRSATRRPSTSPTQQHSPRPEDTTAPDTEAATAEVEDDEWSVISDSDEEDGSFECALDGGAFEPCEPTESFDDLDDGRHTLLVRAVDDAGNIDQSPTELVTEITGGLLD
jgi:large repetitive protein